MTMLVTMQAGNQHPRLHHHHHRHRHRRLQDHRYLQPPLPFTHQQHHRAKVTTVAGAVPCSWMHMGLQLTSRPASAHPSHSLHTLLNSYSTCSIASTNASTGATCTAFRTAGARTSAHADTDACTVFTISLARGVPRRRVQQALQVA